METGLQSMLHEFRDFLDSVEVSAGLMCIAENVEVAAKCLDFANRTDDVVEAVASWQTPGMALMTLQEAR